MKPRIKDFFQLVGGNHLAINYNLSIKQVISNNTFIVSDTNLYNYVTKEKVLIQNVMNNRVKIIYKFFFDAVGLICR